MTSEAIADGQPDATAGVRALVAEGIIKNYVAGSIGASAIPVPLFDIAAIGVLQLRMIQRLAKLYGRAFSEKLGRSLISALVGGFVGYGLGATSSSLLKVVPGVGSLIGFATLPLMAGATTYALGKVFVKHFEDGGSLFDLEPDSLKALYVKELKRGRKISEAAA